MPRSQLSDAEFDLLRPLLPPQQRPGKAGRPFLPHRTVLEGILWIHRTGAPWRDLPPEYGKWSTVYERFRRWRQSGLFGRMLDKLEAAGRKTEKIDFEFSAVDGSNIRAHRCAAGALKKGTRPKKASKNRH
jgi:transposase